MSSPKNSLYANNVYDYDFNALKKKKLLCETILDAVNDNGLGLYISCYVILPNILPGKNVETKAGL